MTEEQNLVLDDILVKLSAISINEKQDNVATQEINAKLDEKKHIIELFTENVKGKEYISTENKHDGSEGHWLETLMNITHNSKNEPDILGYEMKKILLKLHLEILVQVNIYSQKIRIVWKS